MGLLDGFPHTVDIQLRSETTDSLGGDVVTWSTIQSGVEAWVRSPNAADVRQFDKPGIVVTHVVYFNANPSLTELHRLVYSGEVLDFHGCHDASAGLGRVWKAYCTKSTLHASNL